MCYICWKKYSNMGFMSQSKLLPNLLMSFGRTVYRFCWENNRGQEASGLPQPQPLSCPCPAQRPTCHRQLGHEEGHPRLPLPPPRGKQHSGVSHHGEDKEDPQRDQLLGLKRERHKPVTWGTQGLCRTQGSGFGAGRSSFWPHVPLSKLHPPETEGPWSLFTPTLMEPLKILCQEAPKGMHSLAKQF